MQSEIVGQARRLLGARRWPRSAGGAPRPTICFGAVARRNSKWCLQQPLTRAEATCEHLGCSPRLQHLSSARRPKALPRARGRCRSVTLFRRKFSRRNRRRFLPGTGCAWGTKASSPGRGITSFSRWRVKALSWCAIRRAQCVDFTMFAATEGRGCARRRAGIAQRSNVHITPGPMRLTADWLDHRTWMPFPASIRPIIRCML